MARFIKYKKYVPEPASEMSMEDLLNALSDYLLQSGFQQQQMDYYDLNDASRRWKTCGRPSPMRCSTAMRSTIRCASRSRT